MKRFSTVGATVPAAQAVTPNKLVVLLGLFAVPIVRVNSPLIVPSLVLLAILSPTVPQPTGRSFAGAGCPTVPCVLLN